VRAESVTATLVYTYNAAGLRVAQSVDGDVTTFAWDWATPAAGSGQAPVPELLRQGKTRYLVGHDTLGWHAGNTWAYSLPDALGSVRQTVDAAGAVVRAREWTPFGVEVGESPTGLGYTGEWWDADVGLEYLRARWYQPGTGRFTTKDPFPGLMLLPPTQHAYIYVVNDPLRYTDPTGNITQEETQNADLIVQQVSNYFGIEIVKDWGWRLLPIPAPSPGMVTCASEWDTGRWTLPELRLVNSAVASMVTAMGGNVAFRNFMGHWEIIKTPSACGRGCTNGSFRRVELIDNNLPPTPGTSFSKLIIRPGREVNFDAWTVIHELGHAWDANFHGRLSGKLEKYTGGRTEPWFGYGWNMTHPEPCDPRLPGCNRAGYIYGGTPPKGSDANFNRREDFAESVAAYVFPNEAQRWVERWHDTPYQELLWYQDYRETLRWEYVNGLINGTITVP